jgi:hypothetical protein
VIGSAPVAVGSAVGSAVDVVKSLAEDSRPTAVRGWEVAMAKEAVAAADSGAAADWGEASGLAAGWPTPRNKRPRMEDLL